MNRKNDLESRWLWLIATSALVAVGCSSEAPGDASPDSLRTNNIHAELLREARAVALDQEDTGDPAAAIQTYSQAIEENPRAVDLYFARGLSYHANGDYERAEADFNTVLRHEPRRAAGYFSRGQSQQALGKHRQALVSYSLAIAVEPRQAKWYYLRGKAYHALAEEADAAGETGRAHEMRKRAQQNLAAARQLDPISDFDQSETPTR